MASRTPLRRILAPAIPFTLLVLVAACSSSTGADVTGGDTGEDAVPSTADATDSASPPPADTDPDDAAVVADAMDSGALDTGSDDIAADDAEEDAGIDTSGGDPDGEDDALDDVAPDVDAPLDPWLAPDERPSQDDLFGPPPTPETGEQAVTELFHGVRVVSRTTDMPRPLRYHVVQIAPGVDGLSFFVTPANGPDEPRDTTLQTTRGFLVEHDLQLAINAHFFSPWPSEDNYADLLGLCVSDGAAFSPFTRGWTQAFVIDPDERAHLVEHDPEDETGYATVPPVELWQGVGTNTRIVRDGVAGGNAGDLHPRTAFGLRDDGVVLWLALDGRQNRTSEGASLAEVAQILVEFGAVDAINMDGGGSTTLVVADPTPRLVNRPIGILLPGTERPVGSNIGLRARPFLRDTVDAVP